MQRPSLHVIQVKRTLKDLHNKALTENMPGDTDKQRVFHQLQEFISTVLQVTELSPSWRPRPLDALKFLWATRLLHKKGCIMLHLLRRQCFLEHAVAVNINVGFGLFEVCREFRQLGVIIDEKPTRGELEEFLMFQFFHFSFFRKKLFIKEILPEESSIVPAIYLSFAFG